MEEKNELNDIILDKNDPINKSRKIILSVATLGVILIIVIVLMNSLTSENDTNLPQPTLPETILPPEPQVEELANEPLFKEVDVIEEEPSYDENLDLIAKKLKKESAKEQYIPKPQVKQNPKKVVVKRETPKVEVISEKPAPKKVVKKSTAHTKQYFIQVGSFSIYEPNKKFLKSITDKGFSYKYHEVKINGKTINKVLVGPFGTEKDARNALRSLRANVESGAFLVKL